MDNIAMYDSLSRRRLLQLGMAGIVTPFIPTSYARAGETLAQKAAAKGLIFGSAIDYPDNRIYNNHNISDLYLSQCDILVMGYQLVWDQNSFARGKFNFKRADRVVEFAESNSRKIAGHTLVWHQGIPHWLKKEITKENAQVILTEHVKLLSKRYKSRLSYWVVVNEPFDYINRRKDNLIPNPFADHLGVDYIEIAFRTAAEVDPGTPLVLNEVGLEHDYPDAEKKRRNIIQLIDRFKSRGVPIHAIGIESHLRPQFPFNRGKFARFLKEIEDRGLKIYITELDIDDNALPTSVERRDRQAAEFIRNYLDVALSVKSCNTVLTWGLVNKYSWLNLPEQPVPEMDKWDLRNLRKDGTPHRPLPFDDNLEPTPIWNAIAGAFDNAAPRIELIDVRQAQSILESLGYDPGPIDGRWGGKTRQALNAMRIANGLPEVQSFTLDSQRLLMKLAR